MQTNPTSHIALEPHYVEIITSVARSFPEIERITLFGSRALQSARKGSDIDLALSGKNVTRTTVLMFHDRLNEETIIPYFIDVLDYNALRNPELKEHIDLLGVVIYER